ncbi:oxygenase MpaB family protein [Streptomyces sp. NBC_01214]|uniref:oxygenase MpaB family protein n=1 Tax=Streptomyces sp. NBC_01214 TaxID=2903777 RepID=UPI00225B3EA1|nr:oxygenase MpaB family protein [Streptomyces sp. NBC_01214]MCX4804319.1 oxygenase MpaB family protein [Streptomyces sp. NBC_01214]
MATADLPGPDSLLRRTLGEWRIGLVAWRLLVLQTADPAVAAGMRDFSTYRAHPWRRIEHTMDSGKRLFFSDREGLRREVARLERTHRRLAGTDEQGRPFTASDPAVRVWVLVTLYECMTAMRELSGRPLAPRELEQMYAEFRAVCSEFGLSDDLFPATAADVPAYMDRTIRERLEYSEPVRYLLFDMLREAPAPRRLGPLKPAWPLLRTVAAQVIGALTVADLPEAFRERFGLPRTRRAALLSFILHRTLRVLMNALPEHRRYRTPPAGVPLTPQPSTTSTASTDLSSTSAPRPVRFPVPRRRKDADSRPVRLRTFFHQVLDQTGDGRISSADLQAMAHNVCWPLELAAEREAPVYAAFETWWQQLRTGMDADGDGQVTCEEFITAMLTGIDSGPAYLEQGLHVAVRAVFHAVDTDGSGHLCADEYRRVFGGSRVHLAELNHGFRQLDHDGDGRITEDEFVQAFTDFFTARTDNTAGSQLLGRP